MLLPLRMAEAVAEVTADPAQAPPPLVEAIGTALPNTSMTQIVCLLANQLTLSLGISCCFPVDMSSLAYHTLKTPC